MIEETDMSQHRPQLRKVLAVGDYGAGKTHFIGTFPKPLLLFSFDKGFDTVAMTPGIRVVNVMENARSQPKGWLEFKTRFAKWLGGEEYVWPDGRKERYRSVALDSLTFLSELCMNHYQYMGSNVDKKATYTQYQQILENMRDVLNDARRCAEYVCCTALTKIEKDEMTGEVLSLPNMTGSIRDQVGAMFDAVFYLYTDKQITTKGPIEIHRMKTVGGYREKAKIRLPHDVKQIVAPTIDDPNFEKLLALVDQRIEAVYGSGEQAKTNSAQETMDSVRPAKTGAVSHSSPAKPVPAPTPNVAVPVRPSVPAPPAPAKPTAMPPPNPKPQLKQLYPRPPIARPKIQPRVR